MLTGSTKSIKSRKRLFAVLSVLGVITALGFAGKQLSQPRPYPKTTDILEAPKPSDAATRVTSNKTQAATAQFDVSRNLIAGGGGSSSAGNFKVDGTIGQASAGTTMSNGQFSQTGGYWQPESGATSTPTPTPTPTPGATVQFSAALYIVGEGDQQVTLTVTRSGDVSAASSVGFVTSDSAGSQGCNVFNGKASSRCDYLTSIGSVQFVAGETSRTISIPIIDDSYAEGNETFTVSLNNATGASLGTESATTVMIVDNDSVTGPNPIDQSSFFVRQHYLDFLNREPDPSGFSFWTGEIENCTPKPQCTELKRINVSAAFFLSIEFQETGYLVARIYKAAYGDGNGTSTFGGSHQLPVPVIRLNEFLPDTQEIGQGVVLGQGNWQQQLENNKQAFTAEFVQRARFATSLPTSMTPAQYVDKLNQNAGNPLSQPERNQLVNDLTGGAKTRAQVLRAVAEDPDLNSSEFNRAFVLMQYFGYLRRNPNDPQDSDYTGYDFWLTKLTQFNGNFVNAEMVKAFISSSEYRNRFGP